MKRLLSFILALILSIGSVFPYTDWDKDNVTGSSSPSDLDTLIQNNNNTLDDFLQYGRFRAILQDSSTPATSFIVSSGSVTCSNSSGTVRRLRKNVSPTTVTWADIDTGSEASSTLYYVYAVADADASTFTIKISISPTSPSGSTYYQILGYFYNDASSNITNIVNIGNGVIVSSGTISDGGTIPLPVGTGANTCKFMVSPADTSSYMNVIDGGASSYTGIVCTVNSSRVVYAKAHNANNNGWYGITANYILISTYQD